MTVRDLRRGERREAIDLIAEAFAEDPLFVTSFGSVRGDATAARRTRRFVAFMFAANRVFGGCARAVHRDGRLLGVALIEPPYGRISRTVRMTLAAVRFLPVALTLPRGVSARLNRLEVACRRRAPEEPHHYLSMVGVRAEARGSGVGRLLIEDVIAIAQAHPTSVGIALDTENPRNVGLYEHLGFRVRGAVDTGALRATVLFRPRDEAG